MKTFDVVALGELLVDFTENGISVRGIQYCRQIPVEPLVMCCQCYKTLGKRLHLLEKKE